MTGTAITLMTVLTSLLFGLSILNVYFFLRLKNILQIEIQWMFTLIFGSALYFIQFTAINGNRYLGTLFVLLNTVLCLYLFCNRNHTTLIINSISKRLFRECLALTLVIPIVLSIVFFIPDMQTESEAERHSPVLSMYVYSNHYIDHTNHIHMSRYISLNNKVPYFSDANDELIPDFLHYPQLVHAVHASIFDGARMISSLTGKPVSDLSLLYVSYHFIFFSLLSMSAAVLWYFARKHIQPKLKNFNAKAFGAISMIVIAVAVTFPYMSMALYGFLTQAAAELILLLCVILLVERTKAKQILNTVIPLCILNIVMGNVWWVISVPLFCVTAVVVYLSKVERLSKLKSRLLKIFLFGTTILLAAIPAFSMIVLNGKSVRAQTVLDGPYEPLSFKLMFGFYLLGGVLILVFMKKQYNSDLKVIDNIRNSLESWLLLPILLNGFVVSYVVYQLIEINVVNYYGNKLMWTSITLTFMALVYCVAQLWGEKTVFWKWTNSKVVQVSVILIAIIVSVILAGSIVRDQQLILAGVLPQEKRLAGIVKFLEQNEDETFYIVNSQYNFTEDYIAQRFAFIVRPTYSEQNLEFLTLNNYGTSPQREEVFRMFLNEDKVTSVVSLRGCFPVAREVRGLTDGVEVFQIGADGTIEKCLP